MCGPPSRLPHRPFHCVFLCVSPSLSPSRWVTLRARWVTVRARWVTLRTRWVTLRARWVTLRARWVTLRARWGTLRARWANVQVELASSNSETRANALSTIGGMWGLGHDAGKLTLNDVIGAVDDDVVAKGTASFISSADQVRRSCRGGR